MEFFLFQKHHGFNAHPSIMNAKQEATQVKRLGTLIGD